MKAIHALLTIMIIYAIQAQIEDFGDVKTCEDYAPKDLESNYGDKPAFSVDFCRATKYEGYTKCCFLKWEDGEENRKYNCYPIKSIGLADIDTEIEKIQQTLPDVVSLDCHASYVYGTLLLIFALLF